MKRRAGHALLVAAVGIATAATLAGCGQATPAAATASALERCAPRAARVNVADGRGPVGDVRAKKVFISVTDVSISTEDTRASYLPDMVTFARLAAHDRGLYYADAFGGAPHKHAVWPVQASFVSDSVGFGGNKTLADGSRDCDAMSLAVPLRVLSGARPGEPDSPLLEWLAMASSLAAQHPDAVPYVALFTDGEMVENDFDVRHERLTDERLAALTSEWAPRLTGLGAGARVYVVGVGRGSDLTEQQLGDVQRLIEAVLAPNGARLAVFDARLAQSALELNR